MKTKISHLLKNHWSKLLSVSFFILLLVSYINIFALDNPYSPNETLNPACAPLDPNCTVSFGVGGGSWLTSSNGIYYNGGSVNVGNSNSNINTEIQGGAVLSNKILETFESPNQADVIPAITIDNYGNPVIAYYLGAEIEDPFEGGPMTKLINTAYASGPPSLILIHCEDSSCNSFTETNVTEDFFNFYVDGGTKPSIKVDSENRVHVVFFVEGVIAYTICDDGSCTSTNYEEWGTIEPVSSTGGNSDNFSLVLDGNDTPYIIYNTEDDLSGNYEVSIARYTGTGTEDSCSFPNPNWSCQTVLSDENSDYYLDYGSMGDSIYIGADGYPRFIASYYPYTESQWITDSSYLTYNQCNNIDCTNISTTIIDYIGGRGNASSLSVNSQGIPYIAYVVEPAPPAPAAKNNNILPFTNKAFASNSEAYNIFIAYLNEGNGLGCSETSDWSCVQLTDIYDEYRNGDGYFAIDVKIDNNDLPQIVSTRYMDDYRYFYLDYIKCLDEECLDFNISNILTQDGRISYPAVSSMDISSNGNTYISYINSEEGNPTLNLTKIGTASSTSFNTSNSLYSGGDLGVSGNLFIDGSMATSNGIYLNSGEPANTNNGLYNVDGELYWNGGPIFQDISSVHYADEAGYAADANYANFANSATRLATSRTIFGYSFNGTSNITGTVSPSYGGTGRSSLNSNSLLVGNGTSAVNLIAPSTSGNVLTSNGTSWSSSALPTRTVAQGGTGLTSLTANNLMVGNGTNNISFIAPGTSGNVLTSNGTSWVSSALSISTRTVAQGGTGLTSLTANNLMVGNGTNNISFIAPGTSGNILISNGTSWSSSTLSSVVAPSTSGNVLTSNGTSWVSSASQWTTSGSDIYRNSGDVGIGLFPTAVLHLKAGTSAPGTAPFKLTSGVNLSIPEAGALEWNGVNLFVTQTSGLLRKSIAYSSDISITTDILNNLISTGLTDSGVGISGVTQDSIILGKLAGYNSTDSEQSIFLGYGAGSDTLMAGRSVFLGSYSGRNTNAQNSIFIGNNTGSHATNATYSNFIGYDAGSHATNATYSNFIGYDAGGGASTARNSVFIGFKAGIGDTVNNTMDFFQNIYDSSILIGQNTSTGGYSNSIAIGSYATNTEENQLMFGSLAYGNSRYAIDTTVWKGSSSKTCTLTTGVGLSCSSDKNLKTNIHKLKDGTEFILDEDKIIQEDMTILEKLISIVPIRYDWKENEDDLYYFDKNLNPENIGFIAQDLEKYFPELVSIDVNMNKSVNYSNMTPILVEAIRELNLKVEAISLDDNDSNIFSSVIKKVENGIAYLTGLVVDTIVVGSQEKRTGITLYDEETGKPYCITVVSGEIKNREGECGVVEMPDICPNIDEYQQEIPDGYKLDENNECIEVYIEKKSIDSELENVDICSNIEGIQIDIPDGYKLDENNECIKQDLEIPVNPSSLFTATPGQE